MVSGASMASTLLFVAVESVVALVATHSLISDDQNIETTVMRL